MKVILQFKEIILIWGAVLKQNKWAETKERVCFTFNLCSAALYNGY